MSLSQHSTATLAEDGSRKLELFGSTAQLSSPDMRYLPCEPCCEPCCDARRENERCIVLVLVSTWLWTGGVGKHENKEHKTKTENEAGPKA